MKFFKSKLVKIIFFCFIFGLCQAQTPREILNKGFEKLGGFNKINNLSCIERHYNGHKHWIEQSEHHNGPYITSYEDINEIYGLKKELLNQSNKTKQFQFHQLIESQILINGDMGEMVFGETKYPLPRSYRDEIMGIVNYDPYILMLKAHSADDLILESNIKIDGDSFLKLSFFDNGVDFVLYFDSKNYLLKKAEIETVLPYENFFSPFGNFITTVKYSLYGLFQNGYRYPQQFDVYRLNKKWKSFTIDKIKFKSETNLDNFNSTKKMSEIPMVIDQKANLQFIKELVNNVYTIKGQWYVHWVEDKEGIFIIESPISSSYSRSVIDYLQLKYPSKEIKGVIVASDAFPHIAGIREYVASGIPIYTHSKNEVILNQIINAKHKTYPDNLAKNPQKPNFIFVFDKLSLTNSLSILPVNGSAGSSMLLVYDKNSDWLYTADLVQKFPNNTFFMPQYLSEVNDAVQKCNINPNHISGMHLDLMPWNKVVEFLKNFSK